MTSSLIKSQKDPIGQLLEAESSIGIVVGENQNLDSMAAALGLYLILKADGKNVQIVSKQEPLVAISNLVGIDRVSKSFEGKTKTLTISVPYHEGEIEKVSYNIEGDKLNVNLFAQGSGINFTEREIEYVRKGSSPSLIITIGVANEAEINNLVDLKTVKSIHIDRNPLNTLSEDVAIIDPSFSSLSEIVAQLIMDLSLGYDIDAFQNLMDGIIYATRNFTLGNTSPFAFEAAGFLMQNGAKRQKGEIPREKGDTQTFPREDHFLSQTPHPQSQKQSYPQDEAASQVQEDLSSPEDAAVPTKEEFGTSGEVPDDWFLPKVFKGSKKGN